MSLAVMWQLLNVARWASPGREGTECGLEPNVQGVSRVDVRCIPCRYCKRPHALFVMPVFFSVYHSEGVPSVDHPLWYYRGRGPIPYVRRSQSLPNPSRRIAAMSRAFVSSRECRCWRQSVFARRPGCGIPPTPGSVVSWAVPKSVAQSHSETRTL